LSILFIHSFTSPDWLKRPVRLRVCSFIPAILIGCAFLPFVLKAQQAPLNAQVLARVGDMFITEQEFLQRLEMLPSAMRRQGRPEETKTALLYSLIAEKLLAGEGRARHLDEDSLFIRRMDDVKRMLARDQLYREEVQQAVRVTREELRTGMLQARRELFLEYAVFQNRSDADFIHGQLKRGRKLSRLQIDTTFVCYRDTVTMTWGEAEAAIEAAAFRLKVGEHSSVVPASQGYYILELQREGLNRFFINLTMNVLQERVENTVRLRKEQARLDTAVLRLLAGKIGYAIPRTFRPVAEAVTAVLRPHSGLTRIVLTDSMALLLQNRCASIAGDTLLVFGDRAWNASRTIAWLANKEFDMSQGGATVIAAQLNEKFKVLVQQEVLADEALRRRLDQKPDVRVQIRIWEDQTVADLCERDVRRSATVGDADVVNRLRSELTPASVPRVQVRLLTASSMDSARQAWDVLERGTSFEKAVSEYSASSDERRTGGLQEPMSILENYPIGWVAWRLEPGKRFGPIPLKKGACIVELAQKELPPGFDEEAFRTKGGAFLQELHKSQQARAADALTAKLARDKGYTIYEDRLKALQVTNIPMMTYRILGFGGKMFAAPFVTPRLQWLEQDANTQFLP
jgi:hypothetical protein